MVINDGFIDLVIRVANSTKLAAIFNILIVTAFLPGQFLIALHLGGLGRATGRKHCRFLEFPHVLGLRRLRVDALTNRLRLHEERCGLHETCSGWRWR